MLVDFFGMSNSDKERIPTTHSSAPDLPERASSEYPAFLVKVMAPSKNEKNHASVLVPARLFISDSCPYSKSTIQSPFGGCHPPFLILKNKQVLSLPSEAYNWTGSAEEIGSIAELPVKLMDGCNVPSPSYSFAILRGSFWELIPQMLREGGIGSLGCKGR